MAIKTLAVKYSICHNNCKMIYPEELQTYLDNGFKKGRIRWKYE